MIAALQLHRESVLVRPVNTPITPLCSMFRSDPSTVLPLKCHPVDWILC